MLLPAALPARPGAGLGVWDGGNPGISAPAAANINSCAAHSKGKQLVAQQSRREGGGRCLLPISIPAVPPLLPLPARSLAGKDWQQHSPGPTTSVAPPPEGLAVALCRLQDPFTPGFPVLSSLFAVWFGFPSRCPIPVPSASLPRPWLPGPGGGPGLLSAGRCWAGTLRGEQELELVPPSFLPGLERRVEPGCLGCTPSSCSGCRRGVSGRAGPASLAGLETWRAQPWLGRMGPGWAAA